MHLHAPSFFICVARCSFAPVRNIDDLDRFAISFGRKTTKKKKNIHLSLLILAQRCRLEAY